MKYISEELIDRAFYHADLDMDENLRREYSGRGMYGGKCFGIVCRQVGQVVQFMIHLSKLVEEEGMDPDMVLEMTERMSSDSMGMSSITYFPGFTIGNDPDDEYSEEDGY